MQRTSLNPRGTKVLLSLSLLTLPVAAFPQDDTPGTKVALPMPFVDVDAAKTPWVAPLKDGVAPSGFAHLPLAERAALDAALQKRHAGLIDGMRSTAKLTVEPAAPTFSATRDPRNHFQIDQPGDGNVWVFGGTYKASFGRDGATYIPAFGSAAPRNFPVTFRMDQVTSGGEQLELDHGAEASLEGEAVVFHRGGLRERYDVAIGRVAQSFAFDSLPSGGALVVELAVASELVGQQQGDGLAFVSDFGRVDYSGAVVIDGEGRRLALETELVDGEVHITVPAEFVATATMPLVIDPVITTWVVTFGVTDEYQADVAYDIDQDRILVVFERVYSATDHDVWGELFTPATGAPIPGSGAYVDYTAAYWEAPRCANNRVASQFLVVAARHGTPTEIWGRTREAEDTTQGNQFQISSGFGEKSNPDVGGDPEVPTLAYYCVVWERTYDIGVDHDIHSRTVTTAGTLNGNSAVLIDNSSSTYDKFPTISKLTGLTFSPSQVWCVTWNRQYSASDWDIRGAQVRWSGEVTTPSFSLNFSSDDHRYPEVSAQLATTAIGRPYMSVYENWSTGFTTIESALVSGSNLISTLNISQHFGTPNNINCIWPAVETDGDQFAVTWSEQYQPNGGDFDMYATGLYYVGSTLHTSDAKTVLSTANTFDYNGRLTSLSGAGNPSTWFSVVWTAGPGLQGYNIEAATYSLPEGFGPFIGIRYCNPAVINSTGIPGFIEAQGAGHAGGLPLRLVATDLPFNVFCYFLASPATAANTPPATSGVVCVGNPLSRFNASGQVGNTGFSGSVELDVDTNSIPLPTGSTIALTPGTTYNFQAWYRDGATNNLTDAVSVLFR